MELFELDAKDLVVELDKVDPNAKVLILMPTGVSTIFDVELQRDKKHLHIVNEYDVKNKESKYLEVKDLIKKLDEFDSNFKIFTELSVGKAKIYGVHNQRKMNGEKIVQLVSDYDVKVKSDSFRFLITELNDTNNE